jgi:calcineurin-like phosphoesterase family protein
MEIFFTSDHHFGNSHGRLPPQGKSCDVGVDNNNYTSLGLDEVVAIMETRHDNINYIKK